MRMCINRIVLCLVAMSSVFMAKAMASTPDDYSNLKKEVEDLRKKLSTNGGAPKAVGPIGKADAMVANKYGPNATVTTKTGKLTIGGLLQVWNYRIQNDNVGVNAFLNEQFGIANTNELADNDGFRIRRAEIKLSLDVNDDITGVIVIDPTGGDEANSFPGLPTNQGVVGSGIVAGNSKFSLDDINTFTGFDRFNQSTKQFMRGGLMTPNRVLQDAYINYHPAWIPHHDFTIGQFKPPMSEEGNRNSGQLDFVERAMINQFSNQRDLGFAVHGTWFKDRFQYWIGVFDTAGSFQNTFASYQNRSDDNDEKDLTWRILGRPLWNNKTFGSLELGYSRQDGVHGEAGRGLNGGLNTARPNVDGLSLQETHACREYAWMWYRPTGPVRGWWLRGEYAFMEDRPLPGLGAIINIQTKPRVFNREGFYAATGYKLSDSIWAESLKNHSNWLIKMAYDVEFAYRYEVFGNVLTDDVTAYDPGTSPVHTDVFRTSVHTAGINYYWKSYNVRTQINYSWVSEPEGHLINGAGGSRFFPNPGPFRRFREVKNNVFVISQQIMW
ncbi:MAG: hypothetical protein HY291_03515 [Planctomycetes bacterium]|nr:hypothetical protein [Planctomycetota bacterium]